jgi:tetratricopeptide (TPR) repeat protein
MSDDTQTDATRTAEPVTDTATADPAADLDALEERAMADADDLRAGAEYRQACVAAEAFDRCLASFETLAGEHPDSHAALLNWGYAYVDKIPAAGAVTQVILADKALRRFTAALQVRETWIALYTRGNSYVYWPAIFGRTKLGIADLDRAVRWSEALDGPAPAYHAYAYAALGDAHWRLGDLETANEVWRRGLRRFPDDAPLAERVMLQGEELDSFLDEHYAIGSRVETHLRELWRSDVDWSAPPPAVVAADTPAADGEPAPEDGEPTAAEDASQ